MIKVSIDNFDLEQICRSGQCFRMARREDGRYCVIAGSRYLELEQQDDQIIFYCEKEEFTKVWESYFDLGRDYGAYIRQINPGDLYLINAAEFGSGIRILQQDLWEMIVSFLISQQNNIVRIRRCIQNICESYGEKKMNDRGEVYYGFPKPEDLAWLHEDDLKPCNLGYRSKYVVRTAKSIASGELDLEAVSRMSYKKAKEELLKLFGVGEKVADCICLFALHHLEAFPVDTHINQALQNHYKRGFPKRRYEGFQGVVQQYIFYYELVGKNGIYQ
ncbi:MAG: DNA glycosylase [Eubacteriales bacterium]|nr:DNA glycosylase [Eubacteriales bacterium]